MLSCLLRLEGPGCSSSWLDPWQFEVPLKCKDTKKKSKHECYVETVTPERDICWILTTDILTSVCLPDLFSVLLLFDLFSAFLLWKMPFCSLLVIFKWPRYILWSCTYCNHHLGTIFRNWRGRGWWSQMIREDFSFLIRAPEQGGSTRSLSRI